MSIRSVEFHILLALAGEERHGYAILQEIARLTDGDLDAEPGTLYRALRRMLADGWVAESARRPAADLDDERRRYYRLTPLGRRVASAEAERLARPPTPPPPEQALSPGLFYPPETAGRPGGPVGCPPPGSGATAAPVCGC